MNEYKDICEQMIGVVRRAGEYVSANRKVFTFEEVEKKGDRDYVTRIDKGAEEILVEGLKKVVPEAGFIAEEGTVADEGRSLSWIIDPIDGTTNFIHNTPVTAISVALADGDDILAGVVLEITQNECFYSWKGGGSYLDGRLIKVSPIIDFDKALVATGFPYQREGRLEGILESIGYFLKNCQDVRRFGSAATDLCYVACGRMEIYYEAYLKIWDLAAGILIVRNAGGTVDLITGHSEFGDAAVLATNTRVHEPAREGVFFRKAISE
jgi:myo-inositol-1(or 4)-monophosphatase